MTFPASLELDATLPALRPGPDWVQLHHPIDGPLAFNALLRLSDPGAPLLCFMPSAQRRDRRRNPVYNRWAWAAELPGVNVVVLSDPLLHQAPELVAGWLMHPRLDLSHATADLLRRIAERCGVGPERVLLHGSSMGGFMALQVAACAPGMRALAEVPQLDMANYRALDAIEDLERHVLGRTLAEHRADHAWQVSVLERFAHENHVPRATIVSNHTDVALTETLDLVKELARRSLPASGPFALEVWPERIGHAPLPQEDILPFIRRELAQIGAPA